MGYAISINTAMPIIEDLVSDGYVTRPWVGVTIIALSPSVIAAVEMDPDLNWDIQVDEGILILEVVAGNPADDAGLQPGDVVVKLGGVRVTDNGEFQDVLHNSEIGQPLEVTYFRGSTEHTTSVIPIEGNPGS